MRIRVRVKGEGEGEDGCDEGTKQTPKKESDTKQERKKKAKRHAEGEGGFWLCGNFGIWLCRSSPPPTPRQVVEGMYTNTHLKIAS